MTDVPPKLSPASLLARGSAHLGSPGGAQGSVTPAIYPSTTYVRGPDGSFPFDRIYSRAGNPGYEEVEALLASIEGGAGAMVYGSGMAAAMAVFQGLASGDRVALPRSMYWALRGGLIKWGARFNVGLDFYDNDAADPLVGLAQAIVPTKTRLVWVETPANPTWSVTDIKAAADLAHQAGAMLAVDSTAATPILTKPLALGADIVMHAATKYLNGHSDVIAGALVCARKDDFWASLFAQRPIFGAVLGPFECWLLLRGLRTLPARMALHCQNAMAVARHFDGDRRLVGVIYPGLQNHPHHSVATRQMNGGFGGMLSLRVKGAAEGAMAAAARLQLITRATSFGGTESLVEHRASIEGADTPTPPDLLRVSIGLEAIDDLIADIDQALG
jgi:cystathionine gamma-synthase